MVERVPHSMTGLGLAAGPTESGDLRIEVRAVNSRTLTIKLRLAGGCGGYEAAIEEAIRQQLARGTVSVVVERTTSAPPLPDRAALRALAAEVHQLAAELGLPPPGLAELLQLANAGGRGEAMTSRPLPPRFQALLQRALADLQQSRRNEGAATAAALRGQLDEFQALLRSAAERAPLLAANYRDRLLQRVQEFVAAHLPGPPPAFDLVREVALFAERVDTHEELQRLQAHLGEIRNALDRGGEVGKRIEFLLQELLRETNTLGSKSPDAALAHVVVAMKTCIDRLKEQVANLE